jgi:hypothetical protein
MRTSARSIACAVALGALLAAGRAGASHPTCDDLVAARAAGQSATAVAQAFGTTDARVEACMRIAEWQQQFAAKRARYAQTRVDRGLPH